MQPPLHVPFLCLLFLFVFGCTSDDKIPPEASAKLEIPEDVPVQMFEYDSAQPLETTVFTDAEFITAARKVLVQDDFVVVGDSRGDTLIRVFDTTGRHLGSLGRNGKGPGEFTTVWWMVEGLPSNPGIWFFDIGNQRLVHHDFSQYPDNILEDDPLSIQLKAEGIVANMAWLDDETFLGAGRLSEGRFVHFNTDGDPVHATGALPAFRTEVPEGVRQQAYTGYLHRHPSDSLIVEVIRYADRLTIYDFEGNVLHIARTSAPFEPDGYLRVLLNERPAREEELTSRYGFLDVTANADGIYALYSGRSDAEPNSNYSDLVFAFDWAGNFLKAYQLDTDVIAINLAPSGKSLFAVRHYPSPAILKAELP